MKTQTFVRHTCATWLFPLLLIACHHHPTRPTVEANKASKSTSRYQQDRDGGPLIPPDVSRIPDAQPKAEPLSAYGNRSPYTVLGRTYRVLPSAQGYQERGLASWYGTKFHGHLTSNREKYDMYAMTAAHKTLPLPSYVRVTNLENGRHVTVRVNDRGPFHDKRIIDLSYAAAIKLGIHTTGTGSVELIAINPRTSSLSSNSLAESASQKSNVFLQVGAFTHRNNAKQMAARLRAARIDQVVLVQEKRGAHRLYRVRIGPLNDTQTIKQTTQRIRQLGFKPLILPSTHF